MEGQGRGGQKNKELHSYDQVGAKAANSFSRALHFVVCRITLLKEICGPFKNISVLKLNFYNVQKHTLSF